MRCRSASPAARESRQTGSGKCACASALPTFFCPFEAVPTHSLCRIRTQRNGIEFAAYAFYNAHTSPVRHLGTPPPASIAKQSSSLSERDYPPAGAIFPYLRFNIQPPVDSDRERLLSPVECG